ncbi:putative lipid-binding protein AIR1B [Durio zibethinus]|uniref:Lipid-binding protein AIR1B n=1 Tax=Durio zibethinus TaxID=66656 RepID=A0A6P5WQ31_DURZI|nr:putative lipid-binding protein AIR1B [Durio zibethinus]
MDSKASTSTVFFLSLNLHFFTLVSSQTPPCPSDQAVCKEPLTEAFFGASPNPNSQCCRRFDGLTDRQAATCMCEILKANASQIPDGLNFIEHVPQVLRLEQQRLQLRMKPST